MATASSGGVVSLRRSSTPGPPSAPTLQPGGGAPKVKPHRGDAGAPSAAPPCTHPVASQHMDRARGQVSCGLCGEVIADQQFELDPMFARGEKPGGGAAGGMRAPGFARPGRPNLPSPAVHGLPRPSLEHARRHLAAIARELHIPQDQVDAATGLFKTACSLNCISGARTAALCACLYIIARRHRHALLLVDFSDVTMDPPTGILQYVKVIAAATHTPVPDMDPAFYIGRMVQVVVEAANAAAQKEGEEAKRDGGVEEVNSTTQRSSAPTATLVDAKPISSDIVDAVVLYSLKVLRTMRDDWIHTGRRPLGVSAAAVMVACQAYGVPCDVTALMGAARLSASTLILRLEEYVSTPAAALANIDAYQPTVDATQPTCYVRGRFNDMDYAAASTHRDVAENYFELVLAAKSDAPATPAIQEKWSAFLQARSAALQESLSHDLASYVDVSRDERLRILGLPAAKRPAGGATSHPDVAAGVAVTRTLMKGDGDMFDGLTGDEGKPSAAAERSSAVLFVGASGEETITLDFDSDSEETYVVRDLEARIRKGKSLEGTFGQQWTAFIPPAPASLPIDPSAATTSVVGQKRQRLGIVEEASNVVESISRAFKGRGASQLEFSRIVNLFSDEQRRHASGDGNGVVVAKTNVTAGDQQLQQAGTPSPATQRHAPPSLDSVAPASVLAASLPVATQPFTVNLVPPSAPKNENADALPSHDETFDIDDDWGPL